MCWSMKWCIYMKKATERVSVTVWICICLDGVHAGMQSTSTLSTDPAGLTVRMDCPVHRPAVLCRPRFYLPAVSYLPALLSAALRVPESSWSEWVDVRMLIDALPAERREALILTQVLGYSYEEAAKIADVRVGTIRSRVARARADIIAAVQQKDQGTQVGGPRAS